MQINAVKSNRATQDALDAKQMTPHSNNNNYSNNSNRDGNESRQQLQLEAAAAAVKSKLFAKL